MIPPVLKIEPGIDRRLSHGVLCRFTRGERFALLDPE
jgi:hypothetical protein